MLAGTGSASMARSTAPRSSRVLPWYRGDGRPRAGGAEARRLREAHAAVSGHPWHNGLALQWSAPASKSAYVKSRGTQRPRPPRGKLLLDGSLANVLRLLAECRASRDPGDVDVLGWDRRIAEGEDPQRPGGICADARQGPQPGFGVGPAAGSDDPGRLVKPPGPSRVAETLPFAQHRCERRRSARLGRGPGCHEGLPAARDARHLGLLEHDLADQDGPRVARRPPRQLMPPVQFVPSREPAGPHAAQFVRLPAANTLRRA